MKLKEKTSSTSNQEETPKVKLALEEKYKEENIKQEKKEDDAYERLKKKESC